MEYNQAQLQQAIEPIIRKAGEILLSHFKKTLQVHTKQDGSIATNADLESEQYLKQALRELMPGVAFFAEESGREGDGPYCFVIDPLDGTTNFSRGIGYFCISVSLTYHDEPILAVVYQPIQNDYFIARKGHGAYLNGVKLDIAQGDSLEKSLTVVGLPYSKDEVYRALLKSTQDIAPRSFAFRYFGASALDLAYVAAGRIDAVYLANLAWWDVAAGMLLVQEAKGKVSDFEGKPLTPTFKTCLAGSEQVYSQLRAFLRS